MTLKNELTKALYEVLRSYSTFTVSSCPDCEKGFQKSQCRKCNGSGTYDDKPCFVCKGSGIYIYKQTRKFSGKKCNRCGGTGKRIAPPKM